MWTENFTGRVFREESDSEDNDQKSDEVVTEWLSTVSSHFENLLVSSHLQNVQLLLFSVVQWKDNEFCPLQ